MFVNLKSFYIHTEAISDAKVETDRLIWTALVEVFLRRNSRGAETVAVGRIPPSLGTKWQRVDFEDGLWAKDDTPVVSPWILDDWGWEGNVKTVTFESNPDHDSDGEVEPEVEDKEDSDSEEEEEEEMGDEEREEEEEEEEEGEHEDTRLVEMQVEEEEVGGLYWTQYGELDEELDDEMLWEGPVTEGRPDMEGPGAELEELWDEFMTEP